MLRDEKFSKRRTVRETPTLRPIKESLLAQIYQLSQQFLSILERTMILFCPNNPHQTAWNQIPNIGIMFPKPLLPKKNNKTTTEPDMTQ